MTSASSMHAAGQSNPLFWDNPEGWGEEGGGKGVQDGDHMYMNQLIYGKATIIL